MKALLVTALVLGSLVAAAPVSAAGNAGRYQGDCTLDTFNEDDVTGSDRFVGVLGVHTVTTDAYVPSLPVTATVECVVYVNGVVQNETNRLTATGYGVQTAAQETSLTAGGADLVWTCLTVHYVGLAGAEDEQECDELPTMQLPPQWVLDLVGYAGGAPDPVVCPLLAAHQGTYGPYTVGPEGDVSGPDPGGLLGSEVYWECPPYAGDPPPSVGDAVYCPYGHVTGSASYAPALAVEAATHTETFDIALSGCTGAPGPAGDATFHLAGTATDACVTTGLHPAPGTGSGFLTGSTAAGPVDGTYAVTKHGARYLVRGRYTSGGREQVVDLWLDQQALCPPGGVASSGLVGDGAILGVAP